MSGDRRLELFRPKRLLKDLNVLAVGFSLAALTGAAFSFFPGVMMLVASTSTLVFGVLWTLLVRSRKILVLGRSTISLQPIGWAASVLFAILNASVTGATVCCLTSAIPNDESMSSSPFFVPVTPSLQILLGAFWGAIGIIYWLPGLIVTLVGFGLPIASAEKRAKKGLDGAESGELLIGVVAVIVAVVSLSILRSSPAVDTPMSWTWLSEICWFPGKDPDAMADHAPISKLTSKLFVALYGMIGLTMGGAVTLLARRRKWARRSFIDAVDAGKFEGYRIAARDEGKILVLVTSVGEGYRVANVEEPLYDLDESSSGAVLGRSGRDR